MPEIYPRDHVLAQWAYSELNSFEQGERYARIPRELREKQAYRHPFAELDQSERKLLIKAWYRVRGAPGTMFFRALDGVSAFQLKHWTKHDLEPVCIIRHSTVGWRRHTGLVGSRSRNGLRPIPIASFQIIIPCARLEAQLSCRMIL